jgi:peptidoglycan/xylan/chitin deacetylase (PgdA/CDA1 family)
VQLRGNSRIVGAAVAVMVATATAGCTLDDGGAVAAPPAQSPSPAASASPSAAVTPSPSSSPVKPPPPGLAPVVYRVKTTDKVAFITIDDGYTRHPDQIELVKKLKVPVSLFLLSHQAEADPGYFRKLQEAGAVIEAHSETHTNMHGKPYARQKREICGSRDRLEKLFGRRPVLFRPPFGNFDQTTQRAANDCGMKAVLHWRATVHAGVVRYQSPTQKFRPGDVVLMHFRPAFKADLAAAVKAIRASGLEPALLEDYFK